MSKQSKNKQNYDRQYKQEFVENIALAPMQAQAMQAAQDQPFDVEQSINMLPVQLESLDYNDLKSGLNYIRNCIQNSNKSSQQKKYEEQYCYFVRELELRQMKIQ